MCLIIDNNVVARVLLSEADPDFQLLHQAIFKGKPCKVYFVYGGKLRREYVINNEVRKILVELDRAGKAIYIQDDLVDKEEQVVIKLGKCKSDDPHIVALARVAHVRLLCTDDENLQDDFQQKNLIDIPRGKIFKSAKHKHLLHRYCK